MDKWEATAVVISQALFSNAAILLHFNPKYALGIVMKWRNPIMKGALARFFFAGV
jgi:hypothetical protein